MRRPRYPPDVRLSHSPGYVRRLVFLRDKGICARCGCDVGRLMRALATVCPATRAWVAQALGHPRWYAVGDRQAGLTHIRTLCWGCWRLSNAVRLDDVSADGLPDD